MAGRRDHALNQIRRALTAYVGAEEAERVLDEALEPILARSVADAWGVLNEIYNRWITRIARAGIEWARSYPWQSEQEARGDWDAILSSDQLQDWVHRRVQPHGQHLLGPEHFDPILSVYFSNTPGDPVDGYDGAITAAVGDVIREMSVLLDAMGPDEDVDE